MIYKDVSPSALVREELMEKDEAQATGILRALTTKLSAAGEGK